MSFNVAVLRFYICRIHLKCLCHVDIVFVFVCQTILDMYIYDVRVDALATEMFQGLFVL